MEFSLVEPGISSWQKLVLARLGSMLGPRFNTSESDERRRC
jgi:hypothetical protein